MKLSMSDFLIKQEITFSVKEIEKSACLIFVGSFFLGLLAFVTFEGEYWAGYFIVQILQDTHILTQNWLQLYQIPFLHDIQFLFIVTFLLEMAVILSRYMRGWKL